MGNQMADRIIKLVGQEFALSTATSANGAQLLRLRNDTAAVVTITVANGVTTGTLTVAVGEVVYIRKVTSETIAASAAIKAVAVAFGD
jgi:hypothetical protein